jgi:hypothetical protein
MHSSNSRRIPLWKLFGKLRSLIVVAPQDYSPRRSWDSASSREIQLEFDFELRTRISK